VHIKVIRGVLARKSSVEGSGADTGFTPLVAGTYQIGAEMNNRLEVLREGKTTVYMPLEKLREYEISGEIEISK
jgi:hypothetical protein